MKREGFGGQRQTLRDVKKELRIGIEEDVEGKINLLQVGHYPANGGEGDFHSY